ncbi:putative protein phosphatase 2C 51 isoform X2 [Cucumis melo var. makuwa]|uniref:PPM-type phosphatase domain-containing protein n=1 Tax=Cucumis melo var. makuwa TaxID=1194695 RepID=A0A5D3E2I0_CUCMM|nr:putative protein phosphatase 2C 51 isoform X2 [Cucumis melo var. makuwa]
MAFQKIEATNFYTVLLWFMVYAITHCFAESSTCLMVYKEGGAPAVFQSPKCPLWKLSDYTFQSPNAPHCQIAMHQGRRKYQEDRALCALDVRIPFLSKTGLMEVPVGIIAVFDGHNGAEASEMASKILLEYFVVHTYFLLDATYSGIFKRPFKTFSNEREHGAIFNQLNWREKISNRDLELGRLKYLLPADFDDDFHLEILKEALLRAIQDVDKTFSKEAHKNNLVSGSTATVILLADAQILVANIGDSKAFLCSEKFQSPAEAKATFLRLYKQKRYSGASRARGYGNSRPDSYDGLKHFYVKELTRDHHPDREDERSRVEIAGGHVVDWGGVPRVNGQLAISRAIGDVSFKSYGVISAPEVTDWQPLSTNDSFLVASSDGIFEKLSSQDVCDLLWEIHNDGMSSFEHSPSCSYSLADCIVSTAFERGSMDNMAAIVVPLRPGSSSRRFQEGSFVAQRDSSFPISGIENLIKEHSALIKELWSSKDIVWVFVEAFGKSGGWDESRIAATEVLKGGVGYVKATAFNIENMVKALPAEIWFECNQRIFHKGKGLSEVVDTAKRNAAAWCSLDKEFNDYSIQDLCLNWAVFLQDLSFNCC